MREEGRESTGWSNPTLKEMWVERGGTEVVEETVTCLGDRVVSTLSLGIL